MIGSTYKSCRFLSVPGVLCVLVVSGLGGVGGVPPSSPFSFVGVIEESSKTNPIDRLLSQIDDATERLNERISGLVNETSRLLNTVVQPATLVPTPLPQTPAGIERAFPRTDRAEENIGGRPLVYLLPIVGEVHPIMMALFRRGVDEAEEVGADLILLEMDTPGGELRIAEEISRTLLQSKVPTATWIKDKGLSAGMLIAISTQKIFMKPVISGIGDCQPIYLTTREIKAAPEKILTEVRRYGRRAATKNNYPVDVVIAMIDESRSYVSPDGTIRCTTGELLTLTAEEAVRVGLAAGLADSMQEVLEQMGIAHAEVKRFQKNWAESIAAFLVSPTVSGLLTLVGLAGLFIEYKTPGFGVFGGIGMVCLALVFWGHSIAYLAGYEGVLLFIAGVVLIGVEIFLIPGFGFAGAGGILLIVVGLILTFLEVPVQDPLFIPSLHLKGPVMQVTAALLGAFGLLFAAARWLPELQSAAAVGLSLSTQLKTEEGYSSHDMKAQDHLIGRVGTTVSPLKPGGVILLDGQRLNVVTDGSYIEEGEKVRVVEADGFRILVEPEKESP